MKLPKPKLSLRMQLFLDQALPNKPFWDICCDHGYVGIGAIKLDFPEVHFVDQVPLIMEKIIFRFEKFPPKNNAKFKFHLNSGEDISEIVFGTCLIAGVGGLTIKNIIDNLIQGDKLKADRLLLSPHTDEKVLINCIQSNLVSDRYNLKEKIIFIEGKKERSLYVLDLKALI